MSKLSVSTNAMLLMLHALRVSLPDAMRIGMTKSTMLHPDTSSVIFVKHDERSLYIQMNTRYSASQKEFVFHTFSLLDYAAPAAEPVSIYDSLDYTQTIYDDKFLEIMRDDIDNLILKVKEEFKI